MVFLFLSLHKSCAIVFYFLVKNRYVHCAEILFLRVMYDPSFNEEYSCPAIMSDKKSRAENVDFLKSNPALCVHIHIFMILNRCFYLHMQCTYTQICCQYLFLLFFEKFYDLTRVNIKFIQ